MTTITQALKSKTVIKAIILGLVSVIVAVLTEIEMIACTRRHFLMGM